jgi:crossover junction endodeoxyribonuclease RuvC
VLFRSVAIIDAKTKELLKVHTFRNTLVGTTRLAYLKTEILSMIDNYGQKVEPIFIEGYGFSFRGCDFKLAELGGILRLGINENLELPFYEVPPTTLKLFVTGKGNSPKNVMLEQVFRRFKIGSEILKDDNQVDAYALARFGAAYLSWKAYPKDYMGSKKEVESFKKLPEPQTLDKEKAYVL